MRKVILPEGSEKKSYYKYFNIPLVPVTEDEMNVYRQKRDANLAITFEERNRLVARDFVPDPEGKYILDDGTVMVSTCVDVTNFTRENLAWWMVWHQLDPLRYALWNPEDHVGIWISDQDRARLLDESLPLEQRLWGMTSHVTESMNGEKPDKIDINFVNPNEYGYDADFTGRTDIEGMIASNGIQKIGPFTLPIFMTEIVRKAPDGSLKWYGHWWLGKGYVDGKEVTKKVPFILRHKAASALSMLVVHNHKEVRHLDKFIQQLYNENKDNWLE